jgi:ornithine carbamoyltransferase
MSKKDLLSIHDLSRRDILALISKASDLKRHGKESEPHLKGKTLGLIFQKPSTRTRVSFEAGMLQLGGNTIYLNSNDLQLSRGESVQDTARTLSLYLDCLVARVYSHLDLQALASYSQIPVINGLSDLHHPCQVLADLMTIKEHKGRLDGLRLAWIGDGNNVFNDLLAGCIKTGITVAAAIPKRYQPHASILDYIKDGYNSKKIKFRITEEPAEVVKDADIVATDTFISIGKEDEYEIRKMIFLPKYQVNSKLMSLAKDDSIFMHCLPATRGHEVTADVIDGPSSVVWDEAENRLHIQKALLEFLLLK